VGLCLLPLGIGARELAFRFPQKIESVYGASVYPLIARFMSEVNRLVPFSLAEVLLVGALLAATVFFFARKRTRGWKVFILHSAVSMWILCGLLLASFLVLWGFNYARPSLEQRLGVNIEGVDAEEVLDAGRRCLRQATMFHDELGVSSEIPTTLPMDFATLNGIVDHRLRSLRLPGDRICHSTSPVKKLYLSTAMSYMGLSGIFVPFTGEPSINAKLPDVSIPMVVAHEKAHQHGITDEGEANFVAFLACSGAETAPYLRYAAFLSAGTRLLGSAAVYIPQDARQAWEETGPGPRRDLQAIRDFWSRYEGPLSVLAQKVNDTYLRTQRVPGGIQSYGRVTRLLISLDRQGQLVPDLRSP
jgi:hypothetical protein